MADHILIVDDDPQALELLAATIRSSGYELSLARDGFEALLVVDERPPALVISDLNMPGMSGFELLSVLGAQIDNEAIERGRLTREQRAASVGLIGTAAPPPRSTQKGAKNREAAERRTRQQQAKRRQAAERKLASAEKKLERERAALERARGKVEEADTRVHDAELDAHAARRELDAL